MPGWIPGGFGFGFGEGEDGAGSVGRVDQRVRNGVVDEPGGLLVFGPRVEDEDVGDAGGAGGSVEVGCAGDEGSERTGLDLVEQSGGDLRTNFAFAAAGVEWGFFRHGARSEEH